MRPVRSEREVLIDEEHRKHTFAWARKEISLAAFLARSSASAAGYLWDELSDDEKLKLLAEVDRRIGQEAG